MLYAITWRHPLDENTIFSAIIDQLLCRQAVEFLGTSESTFTTGIHKLRLQEHMVNPQIDVRFKLWNETHIPQIHVGSLCWDVPVQF